MNRMQVIELGQYLSIPYAGARLADLGAVVTKYGPDPYGERYPDGFARMLEGKTWHYDREPTTQEMLTADVVLTNRSQDSVTTLAALAPRAIVIKIVSPHPGPCLDAMVQARHDLFLYNHAEPPRPNPVFLIDQRAALLVVEKVLWRYANRQYGIDLIVLDDAAYEVLRPTGGRMDPPATALYRCYGCEDHRWLMLCAGWDQHWERLVIALNEPTWATAFEKHETRQRQAMILHEILEPIFLTRPALAWRDLLRSHGVPCEVVQ